MSTTIMKPDKITVHCSATKNGKKYSIESIRASHKERGFDDIGYHGVIQPDGEWQDGRPLNVVGAHVEGANTGNIGICLIGTDRFTKAQFDKLFDKIRTIQQCFFIDQWEVYTHNQFESAIKQKKACPGIKINHILYFLATEDYRSIKKYFMEAL